MRSCRHAGGKMASIAFALAVSRGESFERKSCRGRLLADRQGHSQRAIAVGNVGTCGIDRDWECYLAVIDPNAPFIEQEFLDLLEPTTQVPMENQAILSRDFDYNVLGFESSHRCRDHQALIGSVDLDRNVLLLQLLLHTFHLSSSVTEEYWFTFTIHNALAQALSLQKHYNG